MSTFRRVWHHLLFPVWFTVCLILVMSFSSSFAHASDTQEYLGKRVSEIQVQGLKRIEKDAVLAKLATKTGATLTQDQIRTDIQALFATGYFEDIQVSAEPDNIGQVNVIYTLRERPVIAKIDFEGNEKMSTSDLKEVIKVKEWSILDINKVKEDVALIQKHYEEKGYYLAKVSFDITPSKNDEVSLVYKVNDYDKVQIKKITFLNNRKFSDVDLKGQLGETKEGGFFSFLSGSGSFKESAFKQDLQRLVYCYLDHGYIKFRYENPVVTVSDDKKWLYISIFVDEGEQYQMGNTDFSGDLLFTKDELRGGMIQKPGDTFSVSKRNQDIQSLTEKYQDLGYAYVNVVPKMNVHEDTKTIDFDYDFDKGSLVYFGEINVVGNTKTYDKVIRRELKIHEGELYSGSKYRISKENVERLGFFAPGEVVFNWSPQKGKHDVVDVEITVKERSTGTVTLGAGWGSVSGPFFTAQISEINFLGRGQSITLAGQFSTFAPQQSLNLGFNEPYTFDTLWSTGFDFYYIKIPIPNAYTVQKKGFDVRLGHPILDYTYAYLTYKFERIDDLQYTTPGTTPLSGDAFETVKNADSGYLSSFALSTVRDKRNNRFETTAGSYQSASFELASWPGDMTFYKWVLNNRVYQKIFGDLVFRNNIEVGGISPYGPRAVPPAQKFYLGGPNNMRGWPFFALGPQTSTGDPINPNRPTGGVFEAFTMLEFEYPILKEAGIKLVTFCDIGNTWDPTPPGLAFLSNLRTDVGFGVRWFSPIGPLRFEWGYPINALPGENSNTFNFFIGPPF